MQWQVFLVAAGGFLGAILRYGITRWMGRKVPGRFPYGTLTVNLLGSFLLGWLTGTGLTSAALLFLGTGFTGAFTTFSTLNWESLQAGRVIAAVNLAVSYTVGILLAFAGYWAGGGLS
ncbi:fluoride efflux transporter FluC [Brevibacillus sp. B_LB10_24]|uniref:fluoride efflux transporter FluC n=1 Tax=Brevibacillus sp. B_LB10_24 TaxID=3380645 RepID=UPI0038B8EC84